MRKHIALLVSISLVVLSPGIEPYRVFAAGPVSGAASAPGAGWAGTLGRTGAGLQTYIAARYGADSPLVEFTKLDLSSKHGQFMAQPMFDQLDSMGVSAAAFEAASEGQRKEWLAVAFNGAAESEGAKFDAVFKTSIEKASDDELKAMNGELDRLSARGHLYLDGETHEQAIFKHDAVFKELAGRVTGKIQRGTRGWDAAQTGAGPVEGSRPSLNGKTIALTEWTHHAWTETTGSEAAPEATINGKPAAQSKLEYKHTARRTADGKWRHDYSVLAIGATPAITFNVAIGETRFTVVVSHLDKSTPRERMASAAKMVGETLSKKDPPMAFGAAVAEANRAFLQPHVRIMERHLSEYESYIAADPVLTAAERAKKQEELARLRAFTADAVAGRSKYTLQALIAQLQARERAILQEYKVYVNADPSNGRVSAQMTLEQLESYQQVVAKLHEVAPAIERAREAGPVTKALYWVVEQWQKLFPPSDKGNGAATAVTTTAKTAAENKSSRWGLFGATVGAILFPTVAYAMQGGVAVAATAPLAPWAVVVGYSVVGAMVVGFISLIAWGTFSEYGKEHSKGRRFALDHPEEALRQFEEAARRAPPLPEERPLVKRIAQWWQARRGDTVSAAVMDRPRFPSRGPQQGPGSSVPESLPGVMPNPDDTTRLSDVAGQDEAKEEFLKILDWLKNPEAYAKVGAKGYKGVLEYGPPGTGKTLMARAIANELQIPFVYKAGSEFEQELVGVGAKRIRELKDQAISAAMELEARDQEEARRLRQPAPKKTYGAVIFIDEIETFGRKRGSGHGEQAQTLNQLLTEMDGFVQDLKHPILWIAATNMPEVLDPALTRGGRFELQIPIGLPDVVGREAVFKVHTKKKPLAADVDLKVLAKHTAGLAPADIEAIVNDAAMTVGRERREALTMKDLEASIDRFGPAGAPRPKMMDPEQKAVIAAHEAGHAMITLLVPNGAPLRKLTIVAHGLQALGFSQQVEENETFVKSKEWYEDQIAIALGGRAGEHLATGQIFSGASNDFEKATYYANLMVTKFGMSEKAGTVIYDIEGDQSRTGHKAGSKMSEVINEEVNGIIKAQTERVRQLLEDNKETWEKMRKDLMEKETLTQDDFEGYKASGPKKS